MPCKVMVVGAISKYFGDALSQNASNERVGVARILDVLDRLLEEKVVSKGEFAHEVITRGYDEPGIPVEAVMRGDVDACVGLVWITQQILDITDEEAKELENAGREDAQEDLRSDSKNQSSLLFTLGELPLGLVGGVVELGLFFVV